MGTGLGARLGGFPRGLGGGVLDEDVVVVVVDEVVVVVEVVESEAEERAVGDGGGPWAAGAGVGCWILQVVSRKSPNVFRQLRQRRPATTMGQKKAQFNAVTMPQVSSKKQLIL